MVGLALVIKVSWIASRKDLIGVILKEYRRTVSALWHTYFAVSAWLCHIWLVSGTTSLRPKWSNHCHRPQRQGRIFLICASCDYWCSSWPSYSDASEHFCHLRCRCILRRNRAIPETSLSVSHPARKSKNFTYEMKRERKVIQLFFILQISKFVTQTEMILKSLGYIPRKRTCWKTY